MTEEIGLVVLVVLVVVALLLYFMRRIHLGAKYGLRPLGAPARLHQQIQQAAESGGLFHLTLGRAGLTGPRAPTSVAALTMLDQMVEQSSHDQVPLLTTAGDGAVFVASQPSSRSTQEQKRDNEDVRQTFFLAPHESPMTYAAGVTTLLHQEPTAGNALFGGFGAEIGLMTEAAERTGVRQIIGTDDPVAMAVASATSDDVLWGEELFAAPAYLENDPQRLAGVRTQDVLRWLVVGAIVCVVLLQLLNVL